MELFQGPAAEVKIIIPPTNRMRFRYKSEKGSHGALTGLSAKKSFPTVKVVKNWVEDNNLPIYVRAVLHTKDDKPHVHQLKGNNCKDGICIVEVDRKTMTAVFQNLSIEHVGIKEVINILYNRKLKEYGLVAKSDLQHLQNIAKEEAKEMKLNVVKIYFEAMLQKGANWIRLGGIASDLIYNQKATDTGELKIVRMDKYSGSCKGGEEIFLLCDKVNKKDIEILFFEEKYGEKTWEAKGSFTEIDVHYQVAIVFNTPPYENNNIDKPVEVKIQLHRPSDQEKSQPMRFEYKPLPEDEQGVETKRRKTASYNSGHESNAESNRNISHFEAESEKKNIFSQETESNISGNETIEKQQDTLNYYPYSEDSQLDFSPLFPEISNTGDPLLSSTMPGQEEMEKYIAIFKARQDLSPGYSDMFTDSVAEVQTLPQSIYEGFTNLNLNDNKKGTSDVAQSELNTVSIVKECTVNMTNFKEIKETEKYTKMENISSVLSAIRSFLVLPNNDGDNILHLTIIHQPEQEKFFEYLLYIIKNVSEDILNNSNKLNQTALHLAVLCNKASLVQKLLCAGADPNVKDKYGNSVIHLCVQHDVIDCLKVLTSFNYNDKMHKLELNELNNNGMSPLHMAVKLKKENLVKELCLTGANVNIPEGKSGRTPLHYAVLFCPTIINYLLNQKCIDASAEDYGGNTALDLAEVQNLEDVISLLMHHKNDDDDNEIKDKTYADCMNDQETIPKLVKEETNTVDDAANKNDIEDQENLLKIQIDSKFPEGINKNYDSGYGSREIGFLSNSVLMQICELLDPPETKWEILAEILVDKKDLERVRRAYSPTKTLLRMHKDSLEMFKDIVQLAGLNDVLEILNNNDYSS